MNINLTPDQIQAFTLVATNLGQKMEDYIQKVVNDAATQIIYTQIVPSKTTLISLQDQNTALRAQIVSLGGTPL